MADPSSSQAPETPPTKKRAFPSDKINYHEKVQGRSTKITLGPAVASKVFRVQEALKGNFGKHVSTPAAIDWLVGQSEQVVSEMMKALAGGASTPQRAEPGKSPEKAGLADVLPHVSPSRVLPALRRREEDWDKDLGFLNLEQDPSVRTKSMRMVRRLLQKVRNLRSLLFSLGSWTSCLSLSSCFPQSAQ